MLIIDSTLAMSLALKQPVDDTLKRLLACRRDQMMEDTDGGYDLGELAHFIVVAVGDTLQACEAAAGYPVVSSSAFEWIEQHDGWFEAVAILSDDGFGVVLFVPDDDAIDLKLLTFMRTEASVGERTAAPLAVTNEQPRR